MVFTGTALKGQREPHISTCSFVTGKDMMTSPLYALILLGFFCVGWASANTKEQVQAEELDAKLTGDERLEHLEKLVQRQVNQELMIKNILRQLEAIQQTLSRNLPAAQAVQIEHILADIHRDFRPSPNFTDAKVHASCEAAFNAGWTKSGRYRVLKVGSSVVMDVYCEQEKFGGGWTVFQRRIDGKEDFFRTWDEYKKGFGDVNAEFWLGNENLVLLTAGRNQMLKVELELYGDGFAYANYAAFWVNSEATNYQLHVSGFTAGVPNPGDSLSFHNEKAFSTKDRDNDSASGNCARIHYGAWWYGACMNSNLNGLYGSATYKGLDWYTWKNSHTVSMSSVRMMMKANPILLEHEELNSN